MDRFFDRIENRDAFDMYTAFAGCHAGYYLAAVCPALLSMKKAASAGNSLDEYL
jgi:hypothetical protein